MGTTVTANYGLIKPNPFEEEDTWGELLNTNWDTVDAQMKANADAAASKQPQDGDLTAIAGLTGTGLARRTGSNTWTLDNTSYAATADVNAALATKANLSGTNTFVGDQVIQVANESSNAGPILTLDRITTTPADGDAIGLINFSGRVSDLSTKIVAGIRATMSSILAGAENSLIELRTLVNGAYATRMSVGAGVTVGAATDMGTGTINAVNGVYDGNIRVGTTRPVDTITTTTQSYTLVLGDAGRLKYVNTSSATGPATIRVPPNSSVPFGIGTFIEFIWNGSTPSVTFVPEAGVTVNALAGMLTMPGRYSRTRLTKTLSDTWILDSLPFQPADADLTAIAAIAGTSGLLRKTAADTWELDTSTYAQASALAAYALLGSANVFTADQTIRSVNAGAGLGPTLVFDRDSATPAASDLLGRLLFMGNASDVSDQNYADIYATIISPTELAETSSLVMRTSLSGTFGEVMSFSGGMFYGASGNADMGRGTINVDALYEGGKRISQVIPNSNLSGTAYALVATDAGTMKRIVAGSGAVVITVTEQAVASWAAGNWIEFVWYGAATSVTFAPGVGVTIRSPGGKLKMAERYANARLWRIGADEWLLSGNLIA